MDLSSLRRSAVPVVVGLIVAVLTILSYTLYARHVEQHRIADQDHQQLQQVIQFLNQQIAAQQAPRSPGR